jgi:hypothetical protein
MRIRFTVVAMMLTIDFGGSWHLPDRSDPNRQVRRESLALCYGVISTSTEPSGLRRKSCPVL